MAKTNLLHDCENLDHQAGQILNVHEIDMIYGRSISGKEARELIDQLREEEIEYENNEFSFEPMLTVKMDYCNIHFKYK